ncbi:hypothetical protein J6X90_02435 [Candidatus Saccharibacteria bacterium]|nr:hypothetical protein [Candidatus Saccharibacteria bacterium]
MAKRHTFKKVKPGEPIPVTVRQLESFMLEYNGRFNSRDYGYSRNARVLLERRMMKTLKVRLLWGILNFEFAFR